MTRYKYIVGIQKSIRLKKILGTRKKIKEFI